MATYTVTLDSDGTTVTNDQFGQVVVRGPWFRYLDAIDEWLGDEAQYRRTSNWEVLYLSRRTNGDAGVRLFATVVPL